MQYRCSIRDLVAFNSISSTAGSSPGKRLTLGPIKWLTLGPIRIEGHTKSGVGRATVECKRRCEGAFRNRAGGLLGNMHNQEWQGTKGERSLEAQRLPGPLLSTRGGP